MGYLFKQTALILFATLITFSSTHSQQRPGGTIAYVRDGTEIRLVEPDGTNDRRLWTDPDAKKPLGIDSLAWRPDGKEIAFSSRHSAAASLYDADLYAVRPDGSGLRKLTNAPDRAEFARFPKGSVSVTLRNDLDDDREIDLWLAKINGGNARLLVRNGFSPSWR